MLHVSGNPFFRSSSKVYHVGPEEEITRNNLSIKTKNVHVVYPSQKKCLHLFTKSKYVYGKCTFGENIGFGTRNDRKNDSKIVHGCTVQMFQ